MGDRVQTDTWHWNPPLWVCTHKQAAGSQQRVWRGQRLLILLEKFRFYLFCLHTSVSGPGAKISKEEQVNFKFSSPTWLWLFIWRGLTFCSVINIQQRTKIQTVHYWAFNTGAETHFLLRHKWSMVFPQKRADERGRTEQLEWTGGRTDWGALFLEHDGSV